MVKYALHYFNGRGLAEAIRQQFVLAGQEFEDKRYSFEEWHAVKDTMPFGKVPLLEVDGQQLVQSTAINRYVAKQFGFAGKGDFEQAQVDALADQLKDFLAEVIVYFGVYMGRGAGDVEKLKAEVFVPAVKKHFAYFNKILKNNGSGYFVGDNTTFVDLFIAEYVSTILEHAPESLDEFPEIKAHEEKIHAIPRIKQWRDTRPKTIF